MARNSSVEILDAGAPAKPIVQDWVELYNAGDAAVSLAGFGLTDDPDEPAKFPFPAGTLIGPGEFVVVFVFDRADCPAECESVEDCLADAVEECHAAFVSCRDECFDDQRDCLESALTAAEKQVCREEFETCKVDLDLCEAEQSNCVDQAMSAGTEMHCGETLVACRDNCEPIGLVADFGLGSDETIYLFDGERMIDRVGVTNPDRGQVSGDVEDRFTSILLSDPDEGERQIKENVAFGRRPFDVETFERALGLGDILPVPTPGASNTLTTEVPPLFEDAVTIAPRNPRHMAPVTVRGRVNFDTGRADSGIETAADDLVVELEYRTDRGDVEVLTPGVGLELTTDGVDQEEARPASTLWEFTAVIPGRPDGTGATGLLSAPSPGEGNVSETLFIRGDATGDGSVNVTDMVRLLGILFSGVTSRPACDDALDVDDTGAINASDPVFLGNYVFGAGEPIPPPFPRPGVDPTPDGLACDPES